MERLVKLGIVKSKKSIVFRLGDMFFKRLTRLWLQNDFVFFNFSSLGRDLKRNLKIMHEFTNHVIIKRFNEQKELRKLNYNDEVSNDEDGSKKKNLPMLDLCLQHLRDEKINLDGIKEEIETFMFGGHDTIGVALSFTTFCLANNQHCQEKVYKEIIEIFGEDNDLNDISLEDLSKLHYLNQCIKESMRLYPPVPKIARKLKENLQLDDGNVVPKGLHVNLGIFDLHRNPQHWPDPNKYDPERFSLENSKKRHPFCFIPFSAGLRNCIGQRFAEMELKMTMAKIVRNFKITPIDTPDSLQFILDMTLRTENGIKVKFIKRS